MVYVLYSQIQLILMVFSVTTIFSSSIGKHTHQFQVMLLEKRHNSVIEHIGSDKRIFPVIQLGKSDFGVSINDSLLINMSDTFDVPHIISILGDKKTGIVGLYLTTSLLFFFGFLQCRHLVLVEDYTLLLYFG